MRQGAMNKAKKEKIRMAGDTIPFPFPPSNMRPAEGI